jgi:hypothetical protein
MSEPSETLVVTFFEHPCLTARLTDGTIAVSIRDLCDAIGLRLYSQLRRLRADPDLAEGIVRLRVPTAGGMQDQDFLILEFITAWVSTTDRSRASEIVQERLRYLRIFSIRHVHDAIARAGGLPEGPSRQIEDLNDVSRYDEAIRGLAQQQRAGGKPGKGSPGLARPRVASPCDRDAASRRGGAFALPTRCDLSTRTIMGAGARRTGAYHLCCRLRRVQVSDQGALQGREV